MKIEATTRAKYYQRPPALQASQFHWTVLSPQRHLTLGFTEYNRKRNEPPKFLWIEKDNRKQPERENKSGEPYEIHIEN